MTSAIHLTQRQIDAGFAEVVLNGTLADIAFYAQFVSNPNIAEERYGRLPIWVAMEGEESYTKTKIVLSLNPDVNVKNINGQTPAMVALDKRMHGIGILFLRHSALDITAVDNQGNDYMKYAVLSHSPKAVLEAARRGISLDQPDKDGFVPAYWAVKNKDMDVFRALHDCGLCRDEHNPYYQKVLKQAAFQDLDGDQDDWLPATRDGIFPERKTYELTQDWESLLKRIERISAKNQLRISQILGVSPTEKIRNSALQKEDVSQILSQALFEQCRYGSAQDVALLLFLGADPNRRDKMGRTPLFCSVNYRGCPQDKKTQAEIAQKAYQKVKILLESGANPNLPNVVQNGGKTVADTTPLEHSLYLNRVGISLLLIKAGAKMTTLNSAYPLTKLAVLYAKPEAIQILALANADLMQADDDGMSPIEHAILNNKPYHIVALRKHLMKGEQQALFDRATPQGKRLYDLAQGRNPLLTEALNGTLSLLTDVKQETGANLLSFDEKIVRLSEDDCARLARLAGESVPFGSQTTKENDELNLEEKLPDRAPNRHTVFRQALAVYKRNQRAKILMERSKTKRTGRS
ncbi:MAG: hypothetical protein J6V11_03500 [Alphaproteobacteria bacterium]|nr:hypothetical protein [Alphaproteobacteria bacterium]